MDITWKKSPNYTENRNWQRIKKIVIHWIGAGTADSAANWFASTNSQVSAHYIVGNNVIYQCVDEKDTAWHAGDWDTNLCSIGIEHEATPDMPMTNTVYEKSAKLIADICSRRDIPIDREHIIGHKEVKSTQCPGTVDIDRLISLAKGDTMTDCEKELEEMRESRNYWKNKHEELERTLETERYDHGKEVAAKQKIIDDQQQLIAEMQSKAISDQNTIAKITEERNRWEGAYAKLEDDYVTYRGKTDVELLALNNKFNDCKVKLERCQKDIKEMTFWEFFLTKLGR